MTPQQQEAFVNLLNNQDFLKTIKREFDRSFDITIDEVNGKVRISFSEQDTGQAVMTVADVAAFLQMDRSSVRRMTEERSRARSHHPIPFVKLGGKMLRFSRPAIEEWWKLCVARNGKSNMSALTLPKGRRKR